MRRHQMWYGVLVVTAVLLYIVADRGAALVMMAGLVIIPIISALLEMAAMKYMKIDMTCREQCRVHQEVPLYIRMTRGNRIPSGSIFMKLNIHNLLYDEKTEKKILLQPAEKNEQEFSYPFEAEMCGAFRMSVQTVEVYDLTGLFCWKREVNLTSEILAHPESLDVNVQVMRRPETEKDGDIYDQNRKGQDVSEVHGLREYIEGDSFGSIHWKLSSKIDKLIVREFSYPANYKTVILYDTMKYADGEEISNERNDAVMALTFALSKSMLEHNLEHSVMQMENGEPRMIPVDSRLTYEDMMINYLCGRIPAEKNRGDSLYYLLRSNLLNSCTKVIYITAVYDDEPLRELARRTDVTGVHVIEDGLSGYTNDQGYGILTVNVQDYDKKVHHVGI